MTQVVVVILIQRVWVEREEMEEVLFVSLQQPSTMMVKFCAMEILVKMELEAMLLVVEEAVEVQFTCVQLE